MRLLARLVPDLTSQVENVGTEALAHVLAESPVALRAFVRHLRELGLVVSDALSIQTQVGGEDGAIPDMVGFDEDGATSVIIEVKFWAGLTPNQPVTYLRRLPAGRHSGLVFLVPRSREVTIWPEILRRCAEETDFELAQDATYANERTVDVGQGRKIAVTSWEAVLDKISDSLAGDDDRAISGDVAQLISLCGRLNAEAFLPFRVGELGPESPRRLLQLVQLVDNLAERLLAEKLADKDGFKATPQRTGYGHYLHLGDWGASLHMDYRKWATLRETPLWLTIYARRSHDWNGVEAQRDQNVLLAAGIPSIVKDPGERPTRLVVPLAIREGVEYHDVLADLVTQVRAIHDRLPGNEGVTEFVPPVTSIVPDSSSGSP